MFASLYTAAQTFDEREVPDMGPGGGKARHIWVQPAQYYLAISAGSDIVNRDFGGNGSVQEADIRVIANMDFHKSNNLRKIAGVNETVTTPAGVNSKYLANHTNLRALVTHRDCVGNVELLGMTTESERSVRRQGWLIVSKKVNGFGTLRPESAIRDHRGVTLCAALTGGHTAAPSRSLSSCRVGACP